MKINALGKEPVDIRLIDQFGEEHFRRTYDVEVLQANQPLSTAGLPDGIYVLWINQGRRQVKQRVVIKN
jgi:hypothetical protein